ncbi:hypothetical protein Scep_015980 [Stephania cephalantha]|uniref:Protein kinase domain-containing protein n=1 Tax=Stephania cephalantha TaxID=152367 RepID=A0AAP0INP0_9MAGN
MFDHVLWGKVNDQLLAEYADVSINCVKDEEDERPTMIEVAKELKRIWKTRLSLIKGATMIFTIRRRNRSNRTELLNEKNSQLFLKELIRLFDGKRNPIHIFSEEEILKGTRNYDPCLIISSRYVSPSYKWNNWVVINRNFARHGYGSITYVINELVVLSQINHKNVGKLIGVCFETEIPILVCEYCHANGTLAERLYMKDNVVGGNDRHWEPLSWESRLRIATEIADAVAYLHNFDSMPIVHRNIKPPNIVLDSQDVARLCGFSLCIPIPLGETHLNLDIIEGTNNFLAPEYAISGRLSEKADVYSFGVVLVEILVGKRFHCLAVENGDAYIDNGVEFWLTKQTLCGMYDDVLRQGWEVNGQLLAEYADVAVSCIKEEADERPTMIEVAKELKRIWKTQFKAYMLGLFRSMKSKGSVTDHSLENNKMFLKELTRAFDGKCNPILIFSAKDLAKATRNYDPGLIIHQDSFSDLYKGKHGTTNDRPILVEKFSYKGHSDTRERIINELVVLSQINHKHCGGDFGFIDPKYIVTSRVSEKADVYGFGVVLLEILSGKSVYKLNEEYPDFENQIWCLTAQADLLRQVVDPKIKEVTEQMCDLQLEAYANLIIRCTRENEDERPEMIEVAKELRRIWKASQVQPQ